MTDRAALVRPPTPHHSGERRPSACRFCGVYVYDDDHTFAKCEASIRREISKAEGGATYWRGKLVSMETARDVD